ncbi:hypothetical protein B9J78_05220 [bacterium Unc6]|nr:hypothetical protein [bacterium Unc6]
MFDKIKQAMEMQKKAREIQKELASSRTEAVRLDGKIKVVISADYKVQDVTIDRSVLSQDNKHILEQAIKECFQEALKKVQDIAMAKIKKITGDVDIGSLLR